jgi:RHS repeat-associated protein
VSWLSSFGYSSCLLLLLTSLCAAADKSGVSANAISLPKGPGSIEGLGESFQPTLNTGTAKYSIGIKLPPGTAGHHPTLVLAYEGGGGNGVLGFGWNLSVPSIQRRTDEGIPTYGQALGVNRADTFITESREELVPTADGFFFCKNEGSFIRYRQVADHWEGIMPDGTRMEFGLSTNGRIAEATQTFSWLLEREIDTHGNVIEYVYRSFAGAQNLNQKYLALVRYGPGSPALGPSNGFHFVAFEYEDRPDWFEDGRAGFLVRTGKRLRSIRVATQGVTLANHLAGDFNNDGTTDYLNRRYDLAYLAYAGAASHWSLLASVTLRGADGVTSLPPTTFDYAVSNPPAVIDATSNVLASVNPPNAVMDNPQVDLIDLNGDGLPDLLKTDAGGGGHTVAVNRGPLRQGSNWVIQWANPTTVDPGAGSAWNFDLASEQTHLADMDGDGLADLVHKTADNAVFYFANRGRLNWSERRDMLLEHTAPPAPFDNPGVVTADVDFDKRMDIIQSINFGDSIGYRVWFNLGHQNYSTPQTVEAEGGFDLALPGVQIVDCNGDRVPDVARIRPGEVLVAAGLGYGRFAPPQSMRLPDFILDDLQIASAKLTDINADGLADLVVERAAPGLCWYWLNLGNYTMDVRRVILGLPSVSDRTAVRWADLNGNGTTDLIYADATAEPRLQMIELGQLLSGGLAPNLLTRIANGIGRVTTIQYAPSIQFALEDEDEDRPWPDPLPFPVTVVASIAVSDSLGHQYVSRFRYHDGYYDSVAKQFRGFGEVEQIDVGEPSAPTLVSRSHFDTGRLFEAMKGRLLQTSAETESGEVFARETTTWANPPRQILTGTNGVAIRFAHPLASANEILERGAGTPRRIESEFEYDNYGNVTRLSNYGIVENGDRSAFDDERIAVTEFALNLERWILRAPRRHVIQDENGVVISRSESFYDDETFSGNNPGSVTLGNLTLRRDWIDPGNPSAYVNGLRTKFDAYGNPIALLDPLGVAPGGAINFGAGHAREIVYDNQFRSFSITETIHVGQGSEPLVARADYDEGAATVIGSTDFNGHNISYAYDPLGRLVQVVRPDDTPAFPSVEYDYRLAVPVGSNGLVNFVETRRRDQSSISTAKSDLYFFSREFVDGLGRKLMTKAEAEPARGSVTPRVIVSGATLYNARHKPAVVLNPCFSVQAGGTLQERLAFEDIESPGWQGTFQLGSELMPLNLSAAPKASLSYDPTLRSVAETNQDGSFRRTVYEPLVVRNYDENQSDPASIYYQNSMVRHADGMGRLIRVDEVTPLNDNGTRGHELNTWTTRYQYNLNDQLIRITDSLNNIKTITYDGLKRKTFMNDPDRGQRHYVYDAASNLRQTTDAKDQVVTFIYDGVNRLLTEHYHDGSTVLPWRDASDTNSVTYFYDTPASNLPQGDNTTAMAHNTRGMLAYVRDLSGEEHFSYDARGRTEYSVKRIPDPVFLSNSGANSRLSVPLVSFRTSLDYDAFDRITRLVYPDNDEVRFDFNARTLLQRISGGPNTNVISSLSYLPSGQRRQVDYGNGVRVTSDYDARLRQTRLDARHSTLGTRFISFAYDFDPVSNIRSISDLRPTSVVSAADPRRNTQTFTYDDLYRLTRAQYNLPNSTASNGGELAYRYDRIANLLAQTSDIAHNENDLSVTQLGELDYGGVAGKSGRVGRAPADPPGPHALTDVRSNAPGAAPRAYHYDPNGNMTVLDGLTNRWDFKDRLVACENAEMRAEYTYDHSGRRITKRVWSKSTNAPGGSVTAPDPTCVLYVNPTFELRDDNAPTKYVFNGAVRVASVTGSLSANPRLQRLRVYPGWNLCSLAVTATNALTQLSAGNPQLIRAAYRWSAGGSTWTAVTANETIPQATVLWISATTNALLTAFGPYLEPTDTATTVPAGGAFLPSAGLRVWSLTNGLPANLTAWLRATSAESNGWKIRFSSDLAPLSTLPSRLAPGQALFVQSDSNALAHLPAPASRINYYHQDHLGSSSVITDANGMLVEETAFYPSGLPRHRYVPGETSDPYQFAQKERDAETGLWHFGARYLASQLSRFISVDPKYANPDGLAGQTGHDFLAQPQLHNLYAFAACNPLKYADPDGLEVVWSRDLQQNKRFQRALNIVKNSNEGKRVLAALQNIQVTTGAGPGEKPSEAGHAHTEKHLEGDRRTGFRWSVDAASIKIDLGKAARDNFTDHELANVIHHELRHIEIQVGALPGEDLSTIEGANESKRMRDQLDNALDIYTTAKLATSKGVGILTGDERNRDFQREIGLRESQAKEDAFVQAQTERLNKAHEELARRKAAAGQR